MLAGKCLCGAVHYAVADEFVYALNCHCADCRRATGSAFKPFAGIERGKLSIVQGESDLLVYGEKDAGDLHCGRCGSLLYRWCATGSSCTSRWARWSTRPRSGRRRTSSWARRRRGSPSPTTFLSTSGTRVRARAEHS
jgi:hypothetical protein